MMKKYTLLSAIITMATIFSCEPISPETKPEEKPEEPKGEAPSIVSVSKSEIVLYPADCDITETISLKIKDADEVSTTAGSSLEVGIVHDEGESYTLSVRAKAALAPPASFLVIARNGHGEDSRNIDVTAASLSIDRDTFSSTVAGASFIIGVRSNVGLKTAVVPACSSWVHVGTVSSTNVEVTIDRNTTFEQRSGSVVFSDSKGLLSRTLSITQEAAIDYAKLEREALVALYNATDGPHWKEMSSTLGGRDISTANWCTEKPLSQWYGVEMGGDGHVMYVRLSDMNLTGSLPEEIGDLVYCQEFIVSDNHLSGTLPSRIGDMQALKSLQAGGNMLSGELSSSTLSGLASKMKMISLQGNSFTGTFPQWIGDMPAQCNFWLQDNCLSGVVPEKVQNHPKWGSMSLDGSGKTIGQINMQQKEGYILTLE